MKNKLKNLYSIILFIIFCIFSLPLFILWLILLLWIIVFGNFKTKKMFLESLIAFLQLPKQWLCGLMKQHSWIIDEEDSDIMYIQYRTCVNCGKWEEIKK